MIRVVLRSSKRDLAAIGSFQTMLRHPFSAARNDDLSVQGVSYQIRSEILNFKPTKLKLVIDYDYLSKQKGNDISDHEQEKGSTLEISKLGISQEIVKALANRGITNLFPFERAVLEPAMKGRDIFGRGATAEKTLAFAIPILHKVIQYTQKHGKGRNPLALVIAPTSELAEQVDEEFRESAPSLYTICVHKGQTINYLIQELAYGVDAVIGTPGRIFDLMVRDELNLSEVQFVVLDEADQMVLNVDDIDEIFQQLPRKRQSMLFSATMSGAFIEKLVRKYLKRPLTIDLVSTIHDHS